MTPCPPSISTELKAEPNLTPLLDVVFQLITFFMLVINFSSDNYDQRVHLPVAGSARPVEDDAAASPRTGWSSTSTSDGHLLIGGEVQPLNKAIQTIKHQADLVKLNLKAAGLKLDAAGGLPTTIVLRADQDTTFSSRLQPDHRLPGQRVPQVRPQGDDPELIARPGPDSDAIRRGRRLA